MSTRRISRRPRRVRERHRTVLLPLAVSAFALGLFASCSDADRVSGLADLDAMGPLRLNAVADSVEVTWDPVKNAADYAYSWGAAEQAGQGIVKETRVVLPLSSVAETRAELPLAGGDWVCVWSRNDAGESTDSSCATYQVASSGGRYPNEPAGFVPWFEHDWQTFPTSNTNQPASHVGYFKLVGTNTSLVNTTLIDDLGAPHGYGKSVRIRAPRGHPVGSGIANWSMTSSLNSLGSSDGHTELDQFYISFWLLFEGADWEQPDAWFRIFTINRHVPKQCVGSSAIGFSLGTNSSRSEPYINPDWKSWRLWGYPTCESSSATLREIGSGPKLNTWYHVEFLFRRLTGSMTSSDPHGTSAITVWANGVTIIDGTFTHIMEAPMRQMHINFNPSGGTIDRTRDDYFRISGIYVSGREITR
jgi:hypothetical protein